MKNKKRFLIPGLVLALGFIGKSAEPALPSGTVGPIVDDTPALRSVAEDGQEDMDRFFKAKELVFKRDWRAARTGFESYLKDFPRGRMRDEAHFWLAQSLNYLARGEKGREAILRLKRAALGEIQKLVDGFPESLWRDDALTFRIEIAGEMALLGEDGYQKYLTEAVEAGNKSARDLKIQALDSLVDLDPDTALAIVRRLLRTDDDAVVRDRCLTLLLRLPADDAEAVLRETARSDKDENFRAKAASLLEELRESRLPVKLRYFIYGSKLLDTSMYSEIPEGQVREYSLGRSSTGSAGAVLDKVKGVLGGNISTPLSSANGQLPLGPYLSRTMRTMNRAGDYQVWIKPSELKVTPERITGEIEFRHRLTGEKFDQKFSVDRSADKLLAARSGNNLSLLMFQFAEPGSERASAGSIVEKIAESVGSLKAGEHGELKTSSIIALNPGTTVRSERMSYDLHSFEPNLIALEMAKATIYPGRAPSPQELARNAAVRISGIPGRESVSQDPWVLIGDLFYFKDNQNLVGYGATLIDPENEVVAEGLIEIPSGDPAGFKVLSGRVFDKNRKIVTRRDERRTRPIFSTLWTNHLDWAVQTTRSSTGPDRNSGKMDFGLAQASRSFEGRDWILIGQIISLGKERKFVARQAALISSDGTIVHGAEIHVNADDPTDHTVVLKRP
jgi:hypothetical protein